MIVTWNSAAHIRPCIESVLANADDLRLEVTVVDNASTDGTADVVAAHLPNIRLVRNDTNRGFAAGSNQGMALSRGSCVMLLNPDTEVMPGALSTLVTSLRADPTAGIVGPKLIKPSGDVHPTSARRLPTLPFILLQEGLRLDALPFGRQLIAGVCSTNRDFDRSQYVEAISGAAMVVRPEVLRSVGVLDDRYRHCGEDVDYFLRVRRAQWRILYVHDAVVLHHGAGSSRQAPYRTLVESVLGIYRYYRKNWSLAHALAFRLMISVLRIPVTLGRGIVLCLTGRENLRGFNDRLRVAVAMLRFRPYDAA